MQSGDSRNRDEELSGRKRIDEFLEDVYFSVCKTIDSSEERTRRAKEYWDMYNTQLNAKVFYTGSQKFYPPIVYKAVNARVERYVNQLFPASGRHVQCVSDDGKVPFALISLLEYYIRKSKLRELAAPLLMNGDIEGQLNLYVDWVKYKRYTAKRVSKGVSVDIEGVSVDLDSEEVTDVVEEVIEEGYPYVEVLPDDDVVITPMTAASPEDAIERGGSVTIVRRWTKSQIRGLIDKGYISKKKGEELIENFSEAYNRSKDRPTKSSLSAAGIKNGENGGKHAVVFETWCKVKIDSDETRLCRVYFAGPDNILSCKRCPYWSDKIPLISVPVSRVTGMAKGVSRVAAVASMQYAAVTIANVAIDSGMFAFQPPMVIDPIACPQGDSIKIAPNSVIKVSPRDIQQLPMQNVMPAGSEIVTSFQADMFQTLSVNTSQITQGSAKKQTQADTAREQLIDILSTSNVVSAIESSVFTPLLERFVELDHQFREDSITVRAFGALGMEARMERVQPIQVDTRYQFSWYGVELTRSAQQVQQQIALLNVLKGTPPQLMPGKQIDMSAVLTQLVAGAFNPVVALLTLKDMKTSLSVPPEEENALMDEGHILEVHPMDDHEAHMKSHVENLREMGDPTGEKRVHIMKHDALIQQQMQMQMGGPKGLPGTPGGAGPGVAGTPRPGAQPLPPRGGQNPPGMISSDQLQDPSVMPT